MPTRTTTTKGTLLRLGFVDAEAALASLAALGEASDPLLALLGRTADPDLALHQLLRLGDALVATSATPTRAADAPRGGRRRGHRHAAARRPGGQRGARRPPGAPPRAVARADRPHPRLDPAGGVRRPRVAAAQRRRRPPRRRAGLLAARRRGGRRAARGVPPGAGAPGRARPHPRPRRRRRRGRALRPRRRHARGGARRRPPPRGGGGVAGAARRRRHGQVRRPRAQLRLRRRRHLRLRGRAGPDGELDETRPLRAATQLASHLIRVCGEHTGEGTIWEVDAALRPEGKAGPLVRTVASHHGYYERWAKTWEFQALLKARPVAGDLALGREYVEMVSPMVWEAAEQARLRRGHPGHAPPRRRHHPRPRGRARSSSSAPAGCATSSSPCSCCSSSTAAPTPASAPRRR